MRVYQLTCFMLQWKVHAQVSYLPSGQISRKAGLSFGALGQLTGELRVTEGDATLQLGLCVKLSSKGLHVPDYAAPGPEGRGWVYSQDVAVLLKQYKVLRPFARDAWDPVHSSTTLALS